MKGWLVAGLVIAGAVVGQMAGGTIRRLAWTVAALAAVYGAYEAWRS